MNESLPTTGTIADVAAMARIDEVERRLIQELGAERKQSIGGTPSICPVRNHFTPGLYCREIFMPRGAVVVSEIHRFQHPFIVSAGRCMVYLGGEEGWQMVVAPHFGITQPGTRRVLFILDDTVWTTFHPTDKTNVDDVVAEITFPYENPLLKEKAA